MVEHSRKKKSRERTGFDKNRHLQSLAGSAVFQDANFCFDFDDAIDVPRSVAYVVVYKICDLANELVEGLYADDGRQEERFICVGVWTCIVAVTVHRLVVVFFFVFYFVCVRKVGARVGGGVVV